MEATVSDMEAKSRNGSMSKFGGSMKKPDQYLPTAKASFLRRGCNQKQKRVLDRASTETIPLSGN
jgi:hypothetical protein